MGQGTPKLGVRATARMVGVSPSHISNILSGKRKPSLAVSIRIAKACGMSLQELVDLMGTTARRET
jgi:transcriptional regulator with XRE-family HTH domain